MANEQADFPGALHSRYNVDSIKGGALGATTPKHSTVHEKIEEEVYAVQAKVGTGASTPSAHKVLASSATGESEWRQLAVADIEATGTPGENTFLRGDGTWSAPETSSGSGDMLSTNNLSDVSNATAARANLGLAIGVNVQAYDANLPVWPSAVSATEVGYLNGVTSAIQTQLNAKQDAITDADDIAQGSTNLFLTALERQKLGYLTATQSIDLDQLESDVAALANGMVYKGNWDASAGSFPGSGLAQTGWFYTASVAGTVNGQAFEVDDRLIAVADGASTSVFASNWTKVDATDAVQSVAGLVGTISASSLRTALNVEDGADVTDATNVNAAGAVMESDTSTSGMSFVIDEDDMASNSATKVPTQQSVKAYVDAAGGGGGSYQPKIIIAAMTGSAKDDITGSNGAMATVASGSGTSTTYNTSGAYWALSSGTSGSGVSVLTADRYWAAYTNTGLNLYEEDPVFNFVFSHIKAASSSSRAFLGSHLQAYNAKPSLTSKHLGIMIQTTSGTATFYASNSNGTTQTTTDITAYVNSTTSNSKIDKVHIEMTSGTNIKFWVNNTLVATHTTNLPTGTDGNNGTILLANMSGDGGSVSNQLQVYYMNCEINAY